MNKRCYIYGLRCPLSGHIRYIGKTVNLKDRLGSHISTARTTGSKDLVCQWIRLVIASGQEPTIEILSVVPCNEAWQSVEREWIAKATLENWPLTNMTKGGEGVDFATPEQFERAKERRAKGFKPEIRKQMAESIKSAWARPETRAKIIAAQKKAAAKPERRKQLGSLKRTPEGEARRIAAVNAYWANPENKRKNAERQRQKMLNGQAKRMAEIWATSRSDGSQPRKKS